jgi:hypothetical protein
VRASKESVSLIIVFANPALTSKSAVTDPLVHHGRHFGRVCYAFCSIKVLITNGLLRMADDDPLPLETVT